MRSKAKVSVLIASLFALLGSNLLFEPGLAKRKAKETEDPSTANLKQGIALYEKGDYDGAIDALLQSTYFARNNYAPNAYYYLGMVYMAKHQDTKALEMLHKAVSQAVDPIPDAHLAAAKILLRNDRINEAENETKDALLQLPYPQAPAHFIYGMICERRGDMTFAISHYLDALGERPWKYGEAWMAMAECKMKMQDWADAVQQFNGMLTSEKIKGLDRPRAYLNLGTCLLAKGDHQGAIENWHRCLDWDPNNCDAHLQLGMLLDAENHISSAVNEYKEFVRLSNDSKRVMRAKQRIEILQQKLGPSESEPIQVKPSPYMRKYGMPGVQPHQRPSGSDAGAPGAGGQPPPRDSGF